MTKTSQISNNPFIWINIREDIKNVGPPNQGPNCFRMNWFNQSYYLEPWSLFVLEENQENQENGWKSKKIVKVHAKKKNGSK